MSEQPPPSFRTLTLNAQGLPLLSLLSLQSLIPSQFDIICILEHWFCADARDVYSSSSNFFAESLVPPAPSTGHRPGGVLILGRSDLKAQWVASPSLSPYSVTLFFPSLTLHIVYLPPSLSDDEARAVFRPPRAPCIVLGDVNVRYGPRWNDSCCTAMSRRRVLAVEAAILHLFHPVPSGLVCRTEHCFASPGLQVVSTGVPNPIPSDHPSALSVTIPSPPFSPPSSSSLRRFLVRRLTFDAKARFEFQEAFELLAPTADLVFTGASQRLRRNPPKTPEERCALLEHMDGILSLAICACADICLGEYSVEEARARPDRAAEFVAIAPTPQDAVSLYKRSFRATPRLLESRSPEIPVLEDVANFFSEVYTALPGLAHEDVADGTPFAEGDGALAALFTPSAVWEAIRAYPSSKSCGPDGIHILLLRALMGDDPTDNDVATLVNALATLFRTCCLLGSTPSRWNEAVVMPIPKKSDSVTIDQQRPIALTCLFRRLFELILLRALSSPNPPAGTAGLVVFAPGQAGFRHHFSTMGQLLLAHEAFQSGRRTVAFLDLRQAYDRVPHPLLLQALTAKGAPRGLISLVRSLFLGPRDEGCSLRIAVNGSLTRTVRTFRGVFQGSVLSPWLFNIFIDPLAHSLSPTIPHGLPCPSALFFADDIALLPEKATMLQPMLDQCNEWSVSSGMEFGIQKCGVVNPPIGASSPTLGGVDLPAVEGSAAYEYLGVPFGDNGIRWIVHLAKRLAKARSHLHFLQAVGDSWSPAIRVALYRAYVRSSLDYALPVLACRASVGDLPGWLKDAEALQAEALSWIIGVPRATAVAQVLCAIPPLDFRAQGLWAGLTYHVANSRGTNSPVLPCVDFLVGRPPWSAARILPRLMRSPVYLAWRIATTGRDNFIPLSEYIRMTAAPVLRRGVLPHYIFPRKTMPPDERQPFELVYRSNYSLGIPDPRPRRDIILWRAGRFGARRRCGLCGEPFHRTHLWCALDPLDPPIARLLAAKAFHQRSEHSAPGTWVPLVSNYTCIDAGCNDYRWSDVWYALTRLLASFVVLSFDRTPLRASSLPL
jgi:Reverse transcriptase (RNA-dependent DNA polymerase)